MTTPNHLITDDYVNLVDMECEEGDAQPIEFRSTKFQYCFIPGSEESIKLHQSIESSDADSIF